MRALRLFARRPGQLFGLLRKMGATTLAFRRSLQGPRRHRSAAPAVAAFYDRNQDTRRQDDEHTLMARADDAGLRFLGARATIPLPAGGGAQDQEPDGVLDAILAV